MASAHRDRAPEEPRSPEEHRRALADLLRAAGRGPVAESVPLEAAAGRVLAEDVLARYASPRFDNAQMDGYLLSAAQIAAAQVAAGSGDGVPQGLRPFRVGPEIAAGTDPDAVLPAGWNQPGDDVVLPVMTGARLPCGAGAVVPVEETEPADREAADGQGFVAEGGEVRIPSGTTQGRFLRPAGSDLAAGAVLLRAGQPLSPQAVSVLASQGLAEVPVRRRPRVLLCTGGDEVAGPGEELGPAQVPDANAPLLRALAAQWGAEVLGCVRTADDPRALEASLGSALANLAADGREPDLIVSSGGISHGRHEVLRQLLETAGEDAWLGHVAQQPGGPQAAGLVLGRPLVGLPGNPVSTLVSWRVLLAPVLAEVFGAGPAPDVLRARLAENAEGIPGKTQFRRARLGFSRTGLRVRLVGGPGSHLLARAAEADALAAIPAGARGTAGEEIDVLPLAPLPFGPAAFDDPLDEPERERRGESRDPSLSEPRSEPRSDPRGGRCGNTTASAAVADKDSTATQPVEENR